MPVVTIVGLQVGTLLSGAQYLGNLLKLDNVSTRRVDRITSDEEERLRQGYQLQTAVRFAESTQGLLATRACWVSVGVDGGNPLQRLLQGSRETPAPSSNTSL